MIRFPPMPICEGMAEYLRLLAQEAERVGDPVPPEVLAALGAAEEPGKAAG